jgi:hypothetical protein
MPSVFSRRRRCAVLRFSRLASPAAQPRRQSQRVGVGQHALAQRHAALARLLRFMAMRQPREVDGERMRVARRVGAIDLALLALEAIIEHGSGLRRCQRARVARRARCPQG